MRITTTLTPRNTSTLSPAATLALATLLSQPGAPGIRGSVWHSGPADPTAEIGEIGDYYLQATSLCIYGPKALYDPEVTYDVDDIIDGDIVWVDIACIAGTVLAADVQAALAGAAAPSADNPFATTTQVAGRQPYHGFVNGLTALTHSFAGTTYTLGKIDADYTYWRNGVATTYVGADKTVDFSTKAAWGNGTTDPLGQWFVWLDSNGNLDAGKAVWDIMSLTITLVATVYVQPNGLGGFEGICAKEPHDYRRNLIENRNNHDSFGAQYVSGFSPLTIGTGVAGNSTNSFNLAGGTFRDEDLYHVLTNPQTTARIGYRENDLLKFDAAGAVYAKLSAGAPVYDNAGVLTTISANGGQGGQGRYGIQWVYATNRETTPIVVIVGQGEYNTVALAQAAAMPILPGLSVAEWKLLYRVIIRNVSGALQWIQSDAEYNKSTGPAISAAAVTTIGAGNVTTTPTGALTATNQQTTNEQLEANKVPITGGVINGQRDTRTDLSPADGATAALNCSLGNAFKITAPDTGAGMDFTIALSYVPAGAIYFAIEVAIVVGTNIPTISYTGKGTNVTAPTLTASRTNIIIISTWDNGTTLMINSAGTY